MESCLLITNNNKSNFRKNKVLFIDARNELKREKTISYLLPQHINKIHNAFIDFETEKGFSHVAETHEILEKESSLNIPLYIKNNGSKNILKPNKAFQEWEEASTQLKNSMNQLFEIL